MQGSVGFFLGKRALSKDFKNGESKSHLSRALFERIYSNKTTPIKGPSVDEMKKAAELIGKLNRKSEFLDRLMRQHIEGENYADIIDTSLPEDNLHLDVDKDDNRIRSKYGLSPAHRRSASGGKRKANNIPLRDIIAALATAETRPNIVVQENFVEKPNDFETDSEMTQKEKARDTRERMKEEAKHREEELAFEQFNKILQASNSFAKENKNRTVRLNDFVHSHKGKAGRFVKLKPIDDFVFTATQTIKFARMKKESLSSSLISIVPEMTRNQLKPRVYSPSKVVHASSTKNSRNNSIDLKEMRDSKLWATEVDSSVQLKKMKQESPSNKQFKAIYNNCVTTHKSIVRIVDFLLFVLIFRKKNLTRG
jgi:hypothetical protein